MHCSISTNSDGQSCNKQITKYIENLGSTSIMTNFVVLIELYDIPLFVSWSKYTTCATLVEVTMKTNHTFLLEIFICLDKPSNQSPR